jgi:hypothetical protein
MIFKSSEEFFILITGNITTFQGSSVYQKIFLGNFHRITFNLTRINSTEVGGGMGMAQLLKTLTALPEVLNSIPSKHMVAHNHL